MQEKTCKGCDKTKPIDDFQKTGKLYKDGSPKYYGKCKECVNAYKRDYWAKNPDKSKAFVQSTKAWKTSNKDRVKEYHKEYAAQNPEKTAQYRKKHREKNAARIAAQTKAYKKKRRATDIEYLKTVREYCRIRRVRRTGAGGSHTLAEWEALKQKYNHTCLCCEKQEPEIALTVDHVLPLVMGGTDDISNIQPLCHSCNAKKNAKHMDYRRINYK